MNKAGINKASMNLTSVFSSGNLISNLKVFTKDEMKELEKFVSSPFHNNRSEVTRFFLYIKNYYPAFAHKDFTKEKIFTALYPGEKYRDDVIRRLSSNLYKLTLDYIAYKLFKEDEFEQKKNIAKYFSERIDLDHFEKHIVKAEEYLESQKFRNSQYYYNRKRIEELKSTYFSQYDPTHKKKDSIPEIIEYTWHYSMLTLLSIYDTAVNDMMYFNKKYNITLLKPLLEIYEEKDFTKSPALEICYYSLKLNTKDGRKEENFYKLKSLLEKNSAIFNKSELFEYYTTLHNYLFEKGLTPSIEVSRLEFEVGVQMLELGLLFESNTMTADWFANVFLKAIKAGEFDYAEKFIEGHKMMLLPKERDNIVNFSYAELLFARKNFTGSLTYLATVKFNNVWEKLRVNHLYIKLHYELNNTELFYYLIDSFAKVLKSEDSVSKYIKKLHSNFNKTAAQLYKSKSDGKSINLGGLKKEVTGMETAGHKWLLDKIGELEKKQKILTLKKL